MNFQSQFPFSKLTTLRIGGPALHFVEVVSESELLEALDFANLPPSGKQIPILIMGDGSNLLVSDKGFNGLAIKIGIKGIKAVAETEDSVSLQVGSGEVWDEVVAANVANNYWGIENLSGIPGLTGAIPVQNVGAYGQEASMVVESVEVLDLVSRAKTILSKSDCEFGYRKSNFNTIWKNKFAILSITLKLAKHAAPNLSYTDVKRYFISNPNPTLSEIRKAIIEIRKNKFPDLAEFGSAGSFFKNSLLSYKQYDELAEKIGKNFGLEAVTRLEEIKNKFPQNHGIKIPTAFLIDICGLKGKQVGQARLWERQPLVIVNQASASASDVIELFEQVRDEVFAKTGLTVEPEPEFVGFMKSI